MIAKWMIGAMLGLQALAAPAQYSAQYIETSKAWGTVTADFNGDGHADFWVSGHDEFDRIWYWTEAGYVPSATFQFPVSDRHDCDAADFNFDGRLDIYCAVGALEGTGKGFNELWIQGDNGVFVKRTGHGAEDPYGRGRLPVIFDFNHDGVPDIYVTNEATERPDGQPNYNHVFVNQGKAKFVEVVTAATGARGFSCVGKGDINHDGWDDLLVCNNAGRGHLYVNNQAGDFEDLDTPALNVILRDARLVDMNGDGLVDLVLLNNANTVEVWLNTGRPPYFEAPAYAHTLAVQALSLTVGDFNLDGFKDIYVVRQKKDCKQIWDDLAPDVVFEGRAGPRWVKVIQPQEYASCGRLADTIGDSQVLLLQAGYAYRGPIYVIKWVP